MFHEPATESRPDYASKKKARLGVWLFFLYLMFYGGFVVIGVFKYELLASEVPFGLNLALFYGIGLILFAVFLGLLYNYFCSKHEDDLNGKEARQ